MTREEYIDRHKHEIVGLAIDLLTKKTGVETSGYLERFFKRVEAALGIAYDALTPKPTPLPVKVPPVAPAKPHLNGHNGHARVPA